MITDWKNLTDVTPPLVKIGTENDSEPPLIIEHPNTFPFNDGERDEYRMATKAEYQRYVNHYNQLDPPEDGEALWHPCN